MEKYFYQVEDNGADINKADRIFFKVSAFFGFAFIVIYILLTLVLVIMKSFEGVSALKLSIYLILLIVCSMIIIIKSFNLLNIVKKRISDYVTGFFLIFFPILTLYFITGIYTFLEVYMWVA